MQIINFKFHQFYEYKACDYEYKAFENCNLEYSIFQFDLVGTVQETPINIL